MRPTVESIFPSPGQSFTCLNHDLPEFHNDYHKHPEMELTRIIEGSGKRLIGDSLQRFSDGDLVLIGTQVPHQYESERLGRARAQVIQFLPGLFGKSLLLLPEFRSIGDLEKRAATGLVFFGRCREMVEPIFDELFTSATKGKRAVLLLEILLLLSQADEVHPLASPGYVDQVSEKSVARLGRVIAGINQFVDAGLPVSLEEVAKIAALHPQSVSRFFQQHTGMSFQEYLQTIRVGKATRKLIETNDNISNIALDVGFPSQSNFNRQFRRIHKMTPSQYRSRLKKRSGQ